jgi:hypothetical protein
MTPTTKARFAGPFSMGGDGIEPPTPCFGHTTHNGNTPHFLDPRDLEDR